MDLHIYKDGVDDATGLYCMYAIVGIVNGFSLSYMQVPLCQYVFGPMGQPGRTDEQQCNIANSIVQMPWNMKVFYGLLLDNCSLFGTRRRGWIIFGWSSALMIILFMAFVVEDLVQSGNFAAYTLLWMVACALYIFADVAGDGMTIEFSKLEAEGQTGFILTTGQLVRFSTMILSNVLGIVAMNGKDYYVSAGKTNNTVFTFELSLTQLHFTVVAMCVPFWLGMFMWLKDPPQETVGRHYSPREILRSMWTLLKTKVMLALILYALGSMAVAALASPAQQNVTSIAEPSTLQTTVGSLFGNLLFLLGCWIFRQYFMSRNWRFTFLWTSILMSLNNVFQLVTIYNLWGVGQDGWFLAFSQNILSLVQGIAQVLGSLAIVQVSPIGLEATVYEFLSSLHNAGLTLNANIQNLFIPAFKLDDITMTTYRSNRELYNQRMANATYFAMAVNILGTLIFSFSSPTGINMCKNWLVDKRWHGTGVGVLALMVGGSSLLFSLVVSFLSIFPSTNCLQIAGGDGCE